MKIKKHLLLQVTLGALVLITLISVNGCGRLWGGVTKARLGSNLPGSGSGGSASYAVNQIFRSVGPGNTNILACGTTGGGCVGQGSMMISGTTATFSASVANNIGMGDAIVYDCSGNSALGAGDCIAFINGRGSSLVYSVETASGGTPTTYTGSTWQIYRAYTSLANALIGTENASITAINAALGNFDGWVNGTDLTVLQLPWTIAVYADATDTTNAVVSSSWVTSANYFLRIYTPSLSTEVGTSQRHGGNWTSGGYFLQTANAGASINIVTNYVRIDGLRIENTKNGPPNAWDAIAVDEASVFGLTGAGAYYFSNNIVYTSGAGGASNCGGTICENELNGDTSLVYYIWNNIIIGNGSSENAINFWNAVQAYVYNNTFYHTYGGLSTNAATVTAINNISELCGNFCYSNGGGTWSVNSSNNISGDATIPTATASITSQPGVVFVNTGTLDFRLGVGDTFAKGAGKNLSSDSFLPFSIDLQNITRTVPWDMGASTPH